MIRKHAIAAIVFMLGVFAFESNSANAQAVQLKLNNGQVVTGKLLRHDQKVIVLNIAGNAVTYQRSQVVDLKIQQSLREQFLGHRAKIQDADITKRVALVRWALSHRTREAYEISKVELDQLAIAAPADPQINVLRNVVNKALGIATPVTPPKPATPGTPGTPGTPATSAKPATPAGQPRKPGDEPKQLTQEDITVIKLYEVNLEREQPRVIIPPTVRNELLSKYRDADVIRQNFSGRTGVQKFARLKAHQQLDVLFRASARDLYPKVVYRTDPTVMKAFKSIHQRYVIGYCGKCHSEDKTKGLYLFTKGATRDETVYTNFMILNNTTVNNHRMIDRDAVEVSLLVQYGMDRVDARFPHPEVRGMRPFFIGPSKRYGAEVMTWLRSLNAMANYPISYTPPKATGVVAD